MIKVKDYQAGHVNPRDLLRTDPSIDGNYARSRLNPGDILLAIRGSTGAVARVPRSLAGANITQDTARVRVRKSVVAEYIFQVLQSSGVQRQIRLHTVGQAVKGINIADVRRIRIPLPERAAQAKIAGTLRVWDYAATKARQLIHAKHRFKRGLMQQLLTGKRRFNEFASEPWVEHRLAELFTERRETGRADLPLLAITAIRGVIPREDTKRKDTSPADKGRYKRIAPGDIGYNTMRMWQGVSAVSSLEGIVSPAYTVCVPNEAVDPQFMGYLFKYPPVVDRFRRYSQGLVSDTLNLKFHHFSQVKVTIPGMAEQRRIGAVLSSLDCEVAQLQELWRTLEQQKRSMMEQLLAAEACVKI